MTPILRSPAFWVLSCPLLIVVVLASWISGNEDAARAGAETRWTMINVCSAGHQADCHLLSLADGTHVLIDVADAADQPGAALAYLKKHRVKKIRLVVISHFHSDHYGRLVEIIKAGIAVERVALNLPGDRRIADREMPWGCNWEDVQAVLAFLRERGIPYFTPKAGERLLEVTHNGLLTTLDTVCLYDGINTPIGETDINDTSILVRFTHGTTRALFTGDLNLRLGEYLATSDFDLKADLLKVPHHGTEGVAPNEFFKRVGARAALVPSPTELWFSLRSKRVRDYFKDAGTPTYVSGMHGDVTVRFTGTDFRVMAQRVGLSLPEERPQP